MEIRGRVCFVVKTHMEVMGFPVEFALPPLELHRLVRVVCWSSVKYIERRHLNTYCMVPELERYSRVFS